jgi:hypothetical protein
MSALLAWPGAAGATAAGAAGPQGQRVAHAAAPAAASLAAHVALDGVYIPALFLTGSAGKSPEAAARATAAMQRLTEAWPARHAALAALYPQDKAWRAALGRVQLIIAQASAEVGRQAWPASHETLEGLRETLFEARATRGVNYLLDDCTRFHTVMEKLTAAAASPAPVVREAMAADFALARTLWHRIERQSVDAQALGLSPERLKQWRTGAADEAAALTRLSDALRQGDEARLRQAATATKAPFVRAYTAFGWPVGETPQLTR